MKVLEKRATDEFMRMCDGGADAWGIEYDTQAKTFAEFVTNVE